MLTVLLLLIGFLLLVKGADFFVEGSSSIAKNLRIPSVIIGLTIVAFGTSAPELAVSVSAAYKGSNEIALANVVGSNIFNLLFVAGISAVIIPLKIDKNMLRKDYPLSIFAALLLLLLCIVPNMDTMILERIDGIILLVFFVLFMYITIKRGLKERTEKPESEPAGKNKSILTSIVLSILGLVGIIAGGDMVVDSAVEIASKMGLSETLIGLTIVAIGTSLPELVTSIVAAKKGENDIAMGNVIGSNIFNILFILGCSSFIHPIGVTTQSIYDIIILAVISFLFFIPMLRKKGLSRPVGLVMILTYIGYTAYIIIR